MRTAKRFSSQSGIAIGPILFILAILALLAAVMSAGSGDYQVASVADRITADTVAQANLIRGTINQCNMEYTLAVSNGSVDPSTDPYPVSDTEGTPAAKLGCAPTGKVTLWGDKLIPPPTSGFNPWMYIDASASGGGRCIWSSPSTANPAANEAITSGLGRAASKFNITPAFSTASEGIYDPKSASQKFVLWISMPETAPDSHCLP